MACVACGSASVETWRTAAAVESFAARGAYRLERCGDCGSAWIAGADRLAEDEALYASGVYDLGSARGETGVELLRRLGDLDRLRLVGRLPPESSVFEIGAGDGRLLRALRRRGYRVAGNEPSQPFADALRRQGFTVATEPVEDVELEPASVTAVILWHVLEHLDNPGAVVERARTWLTPGGCVVVAVPNLASLQAAVGGDRWFHQDVPRHRTLFTETGLRRLLGRSGFDVVADTTLTLDQSLLGMWQTLLNRITRDPNVLFRAVKRQHVGQRDLVVTALAAPVLAPVAALLELAAGIAGHGGSAVMRAVAR